MNFLTKSNKVIEAKLLGLSAKSADSSYSAVTDDIEVMVWPEFVDSQVSLIGNLFIWAYHVRVENHGKESAKLVARHWRIIDEQGVIQEVDGEGVVGEQPRILPFESFEYSSGVHLRHPSGIMSGHYIMQKEDGTNFEVKIPAFSLDAPSIKNVVN